MEDLKAIVEALLFASETPLSADRIREVLCDCEIGKIHRQLQEIREAHDQRRGGFILEEIAGGFQFRTRTDLAPWIRKLKGNKPLPLTPAAMETLAVVAYRQPVVKIDIDNLRGVNSGGALKRLLDRKLIRIVGRKDVPGKPILYGTTRKFLEVFNLRDLSELPTLRELRDLQE